MPAKRKIDGQEFINDIRAGMSDTELMEKYALSSRMLESLFRRLLNAKLVNPAEIYERSPYEETTIDVASISYSLEGYTMSTTTIYDVTEPQVLGTVTELVDDTIRTRGIEAGFSETKTFIIYSGKAAKIEPVFLKAKCRWCREEDVSGTVEAEFEITHIDDEHARELKKLKRAFARKSV